MLFRSTNPFREDLPKPKVNQFGHTILSENESNIDLSNYNFEIDDSGQAVANLSQSLFDSPQMSNWIKSRQIEPETEPNNPEPARPNIIPNNVDISALISELNEMDGTAEAKQNISVMKQCANEKCAYALPKDASYCLKCGTFQAPKFCTECGYKFPGVEKFCPDCGTKR